MTADTDEGAGQGPSPAPGAAPSRPAPDRPARPRRAPVVVLVLVAVFAVIGVGLALDGSRAVTRDDQVRAIATTLRCPVCAGEDVADSAAPLAESMRLVIGEQLDQGRSPGQIREWFAQTYGDDVLLAPPVRGAGMLLWALPLVVLAAAGVLLARRWRPGWRSTAAGIGVAAAVLAVWLLPSAVGAGIGAPGTTGGDDLAPLAMDTAPLGVLRAGVAELPGSVSMRATLAGQLEEVGAYEEAAQEYAALVRLRPLDPDIRYREAFALVRAGDTDTARVVLQDALTLQEDHPETLLLLGTLEQTADDAEGARLLTRFLEVAPDHPQADQVRDWLTQREEGS